MPPAVLLLSYSQVTHTQCFAQVTVARETRTHGAAVSALWLLSRLFRLCARSFLVAPSVRYENVVANLHFLSPLFWVRELHGLSRVHLRGDLLQLEGYVYPICPRFSVCSCASFLSTLG